MSNLEEFTCQFYAIVYMSKILNSLQVKFSHLFTCQKFK